MRPAYYETFIHCGPDMCSISFGYLVAVILDKTHNTSRSKESRESRGRAENEDRCCVISFHAKNRSEMTDRHITETLCSCKTTTAFLLHRRSQRNVAVLNY